MIGTGIYLSIDSYFELSQSAQAEIQAKMGLKAPPPSTIEPAGLAPAMEEGPAELTVALVRRLAEKLGGKTSTALRVIAQSDAGKFRMSEVIGAIEDAETYMDVRAVWAALTRRTRKILDDREADLIWWEGDGVYDDDEEYVDHVGRVSPLTHRSLRAHFGIE